MDIIKSTFLGLRDFNRVVAQYYLYTNMAAAAVAVQVSLLYTLTRTRPPVTINQHGGGGSGDEGSGGDDLTAMRCSLYRVIFCKLLSFCSKTLPSRI